MLVLPRAEQRSTYIFAVCQGISVVIPTGNILFSNSKKRNLFSLPSPSPLIYSPKIMRHIRRVLGSLALVLISCSSLTAGEASRPACYSGQKLLPSDCNAAITDMRDQIHTALIQKGMNADDFFILSSYPLITPLIRLPLVYVHHTCAVTLTSGDDVISTLEQIYFFTARLYNDCVVQKGTGGHLMDDKLIFVINNRGTYLNDSRTHLRSPLASPDPVHTGRRF
jgi:hypothetical protein